MQHSAPCTRYTSGQEWPKMYEPGLAHAPHARKERRRDILKHHCRLSKSTKFAQCHIDLVGPLPNSRGRIYLFVTCDRFSRWIEAAPICDISADTIARTFFETRISRYGIPNVVTSDCGTQFTSDLHCGLTQLLGTKHIVTTANHPKQMGKLNAGIVASRSHSAVLVASGLMPYQASCLDSELPSMILVLHPLLLLLDVHCDYLGPYSTNLTWSMKKLHRMQLP